ncbi:MAG: hypothetical protein RBS80_06320 [Thermoguttaceae bacterium]|nr:hypothetical protein [Thermoguttaceae bacterium]
MEQHPISILNSLGWSLAWKDAFLDANGANGAPARVVREHRGVDALVSEAGGTLAEVSGGFRHRAQMRRDFPAVGDWVVVEQPAPSSRAVIHSVLPRRSAFVRRSAGAKSEDQVVAANVDTVFLVSGLDHDFKLRQCKEIRHHQVEQDIHLQNEVKKHWKAIHRSMRFHHKWRQRE